MQGSGNYIDAAGVIDKLKKDKRFSSSFKRLGKGLPDDKRSDKKPPSPNMYPQSSKPIAANVPETPEAETYDKADVKKVSDWLNNQFPGKWPFRGQDLRQPLKAGLAAGPGTPEWRHAGKAVDDTKGAFSDAPRVQRKRVEPPRPGGKLGALLKQADAARDDKERGAKKGEVRHWKSGDYQKQDDGSWKHLPGKGKNGG
jgi:hypothetical protein